MSFVKNIFLFFCIYKMYPILAEGYKNAGVDLLIVKKSDGIWTKMKKHTKWFRSSKHF